VGFIIFVNFVRILYMNLVKEIEEVSGETEFIINILKHIEVFGLFLFINRPFQIIRQILKLKPKF
jgi:hypothetical protein